MMINGDSSYLFVDFHSGLCEVHTRWGRSIGVLLLRRVSCIAVLVEKKKLGATGDLLKELQE